MSVVGLPGGAAMANLLCSWRWQQTRPGHLGIATHSVTPNCLHPCNLPGLGFEDCSTPVLNISRAELSANKTFQLAGERVEPDQ